MGSEILHEAVPWTTTGTKYTTRVIRDLWDTIHMIGKPCVGLAAPQIGEMGAICIIKEGSVAMINPKIIMARGRHPSVEGCYSIPGYEVIVPRATEITVAYQDDHKNYKLFKPSTLRQAIVLQHEIDHINGILISDYVELKKDKSGGILINKYNRSNHTATAYLSQVVELGPPTEEELSVIAKT